MCLVSTCFVLDILYSLSHHPPDICEVHILISRDNKSFNPRFVWLFPPGRSEYLSVALTPLQGPLESPSNVTEKRGSPWGLHRIKRERSHEFRLGSDIASKFLQTLKSGRDFSHFENLGFRDINPEHRKFKVSSPGDNAKPRVEEVCLDSPCPLPQLSE